MNERPFLVIIPGFFNTDILWRRQVELLSEIADVHVTQQHLRHDNFEAIAEAVLAESPPNFAVAGISTGGYCALLVKKLGGDRVTGLCLIGSAPNLEPAGLGKGILNLRDMLRNEDFASVKQALIPLFLNDDNQRSKSMTAVVDTMAETIGAERTTQQLTALKKGADLRDELSEIMCPTLVMCGATDKLMPPALSREVITRIRRSKLVIVKEAAHLLPLERPETVAEFMRNWLMGNLAMDREEIHL